MNNFISCWNIILGLLVLSSCGSVYYNRDGSKMARQIFPVRDRYPIDSAQFKLLNFNVGDEGKEVVTPSIRYVLAKDASDYAKIL
jgi:hypothetical protein